MQWTLFFVILALALVATCNAARQRYDGHSIIHATPETEEHVQFLADLHKQGIYFIEGPMQKTGITSILLLSPDQKQIIMRKLKNAEVNWTETVSNVQEIIDQETVNTEKLDLHAANEARLQWDRYYNLADIYDFIDTLAWLHSPFVSTATIGRTYEGRPMRIIKISKSNETRPAIWIDSLIHAREWITGAVGTYLLDQLVSNQGDEEIQDWLNRYDFYYLPVFNADGYSYTHTTDRLWRKTRSPNPGSSCSGTDANRNFDYAWMEGGGASDDPCSSAFAGAAPFSEVETAAVRDFINTIADRLVFYLSLHSSGQYILIPYGDTNARIPQYNTYLRIGQDAAAAHARRNGTIFTPGNVVDLMYVASGISMDWVKYQHNPDLVLTYELRDRGQFGHLLPASQIYDSGVEFLEGFRVLMRELIKGIPPIDP